MKQELVSRYDKGELFIGQRIPMMKMEYQFVSNEEIKMPESNFEEIIITQELIARFRTEIREEWR